MKRTVGEKVFNVFNMFIMIILMIVALYPIIYSLFASFSKASEFIAHTGFLYKPAGFSLAAYKAVFNNNSIITGFKNTGIVMAGGLAVSIFLTVLGAYVLSRKNARLIPYMSLLIIFTMFFGGGLIPGYLNIKSLNLDDTLWVLIVPTAINTFNLIVMRTAFDALPIELEESATIDGAGRFTILFKILLPLVVPTLMVIILYYAVQIWNSWFNAMIYLRDRKLFPLQLILREILILNTKDAIAQSGMDEEGVSETIQYATMMVATVPILVLYPFLQRYFVKGVMVGAVKG
ncbi:MAG: carbohydrate ABC transporter permease [Oscillospiraceae bacterium]